jgi:hypothetical protein
VQSNTESADGISEFARQLLQQNTTSDKIEKPGGKPGGQANKRGDDGLSSIVYRAQMVRNKLDPNSKLHPDIVYYGKRDSTRAARFHSPITELVDNEGNPAGIKNCHGLKSYNETFAKLLDSLGPLLINNPHFSIPIFTEHRKDNVIYRADPCSQFCTTATNNNQWCDWAIFLQKKHNRGKGRHHPGQILGFVNF